MSDGPANPDGAHGSSRSSEMLEVVTTGLPFCVFKVLVALVVLRSGRAALALPLLVLAAADAALNLANLASLVATGRRAVSACLFAEVAHRAWRVARSPDEWVRDVGNAADVLLSFTLVAGMVGLGGIAHLQPRELSVWNVAVVLNVLGAGLARVRASVKRVL